jgi:hypothetical protein
LRALFRAKEQPANAALLSLFSSIRTVPSGPWGVSQKNRLLHNIAADALENLLSN